MILAVEWMIRKHGIERVGVLTLSFGVPDSGKALTRSGLCGSTQRNGTSYKAVVVKRQRPENKSGLFLHTMRTTAKPRI
jgi:hypothetical protein